MKRFALFVLLSACGPSYPNECSQLEHIFKAVFAQGSCDDLRVKVVPLVAKGILEATVTAAEGAEYARVFSDVELFVSSDVEVRPGWSGLAERNRIEVGVNMWSLLHEEIHVVRYARGILPQAEARHEDWDALGFNALSDFYVWFVVNVKSCTAREEHLRSDHHAILRNAGWDVDGWDSLECGDGADREGVVNLRPLQ